MTRMIRSLLLIGGAISSLLLAMAITCGLALAETGPAQPNYGIAVRGLPALPANFAHLPYANPDAPKGGKLTLGFLGTFDSLNPFNLLAGSTAQGLLTNVYQSLMMRSFDEPYTLYGLIAETIDTDAERSFITFHINPRAHFSDGSPILAKDVLFSFNLLKTQGRPQQRLAYSLVKSVTLPDALSIRFDLSGLNDREMPLTLGMMPILSAAKTDVKNFANASLTPMMGSGPYQIGAVQAGKELVLERDPHYWGSNLPINRGLYNFDRLDLVYYRDADSMFEAFRAGLIDYREENDPVRWTTGYDFPAMRDGRMMRETLAVGGPKGLEGFVFNTRRPLFADVRVREALSNLFDFEWINTNLFHGLYQRTNSFFADSDLSSIGHAESAGEAALLAPYPGLVRPDMMAGRWLPPRSDGSGRDRALALTAFNLLRAAGFEMVAGKLAKAGKTLSFEIMVGNRAQERLALNYAQSMQRLGIDATVRLVDDVQYQRRRQNFDFDMMLGSWIASASPGNEQRGRWGSLSANVHGSFNLAGVQSRAIDALIDAMLAARTNDQFTDAVRAFDRVLLSGFYVVPIYHNSNSWIAASSALAHPAHLIQFGQPLFGATLDEWWVMPTASTPASKP